MKNLGFLQRHDFHHQAIQFVGHLDLATEAASFIRPVLQFQEVLFVFTGPAHTLEPLRFHANMASRAGAHSSTGTDYPVDVILVGDFHQVAGRVVFRDFFTRFGYKGYLCHVLNLFFEVVIPIANGHDCKFPFDVQPVNSTYPAFRNTLVYLPKQIPFEQSPWILGRQVAFFIRLETPIGFQEAARQVL